MEREREREWRQDKINSRYGHIFVVFCCSYFLLGTIRTCPSVLINREILHVCIEETEEDRGSGRVVDYLSTSIKYYLRDR